MHDSTAFERFLLSLSARLTTVPDGELDGALDLVLRDIGEALGTDRVTLLEYRPVGGSEDPSLPRAESGAGANATHAWARSGFDAAALGAPLSAELPWYHAAIVRGEVVALAHVEGDLPSPAARDREFARAAGLKSHLTVPIAVGGRLVCALSTSTFRHYCTWSDHLIDRFRLVGQIVAQAIVRSRMAAAAPEASGPRRASGSRHGAAPMRRLDEVERDYILKVIDRCRGKINGRGHAAETLGLHPNTLRSRMKKLGIRRRGRRV